MFSNESLLELLVSIPPILFSLVIHEYAHARTALAFGDDTARRMGRCTLNPVAHLDPIGTLCLLFAHFGWAKPVPVNHANLHPAKLGSIMVSLAGPMSNLALAIVACLLMRLTLSLQLGSLQLVMPMLYLTFSINVMLFIFNLLPLFPLDGHHIVREQLDPRDQPAFMEWQLKYGQFILMGVILAPMITRQLGMHFVDPVDRIYSFVSHNLFDLLVVPGRQL